MMISSNSSSIYFDKAYMYIKFNTTIFGPSVISNGKMTVTRGANFTNTNIYKDWVYDFDYTGNSDKVWVSFFYDNQSQNRVTLSNTPVLLMQFKIELLNASVDWTQADLSFFDPVYTATNCFYSTTSIGYNNRYLYNQVIYTPLSLPLPFISGFSPSSRIAGVGDVLTIQGSNFGASKGKVFFRSADDGGNTYLKGLESQYIESWSNSQIKVKVPSLVYDGYSAGGYSGGAGSGTIKIKTAQGDSCISTSTLSIPYSIMNGRMGSNASIRRVYLSRYECNPDFEFTLHSEFNSPAHSSKVTVIDSALSHWSKLTGLVLRLEKNSSNQYVYTNSTNLPNKNIIQFTSWPDPYVNNALGALTYADTIYFRAYGSNIFFPRNTNFFWNYNLSGHLFGNERSFYQVTMHELGHILQVGHVNDVSDLMYYQQLGGHYIININSNDIVCSAVNNNITESKKQNWFSGNSGRYPPGALYATF